MLDRRPLCIQKKDLCEWVNEASFIKHFECSGRVEKDKSIYYLLGNGCFKDVDSNFGATRWR